MTPPLTLGVRSAWILLAAAAAVLVAVGFGLFTAVQLSQDALRLGDFPTDQLAIRVTLVMQLIGPGPSLLPLLASMLLAGCLVLTGRGPVRSGGRGQQLGLLASAAVAGLFAVTYAAAAALALTADRALTEDMPLLLFNLSNLVTVLAVNLAALGLLAAAFLSGRVPGQLPTGPNAPDKQNGAASAREPTAESAEATAPQTPLRPSNLTEGPPDLIESRHSRDQE
jgi:hypothetical protein